MIFTTSQWLLAALAGILVGWMTPAIMKDTILMPYGKGIISGLAGSLLGALLYGQSTTLAKNGPTFLSGLVGGLVLYFLVRSFSKSSEENT